MGQINIDISKKVFNEVYLPYLDNEDKYLVFYGGGSSGKSYFIVQRYIYKILKNERMNLLVVRATGDTNRTSTFALFKQIISDWNLKDYFKIRESDMNIKCKLNNKSHDNAWLYFFIRALQLYHPGCELGSIWEAHWILDI